MHRNFVKRDSGSWIEVSGVALRLMPDDGDGERHQRFIIGIPGRQTLLVAHNLDLAERLPIGIGDRVLVRGIYEWNEYGGLVHWTHPDPLGLEAGGYVRSAQKAP